MEIASKNLTVRLITSVDLAGDAIIVGNYAGPVDLEGAQTIVSLDSLLQEHLHMHEYASGKYAPEALEELLKIKKLVDSYIRKLKARPQAGGARGGRGGRRG